MSDQVAEVIRAVGPTGVIGVLLDGPQLTSRWAARYASVLADDPGSTVLTLTSFGMVQRSRPGRRDASTVVALWKDPERGFREIPLESGAQAVLLTACTSRATRRTGDGRWPVDTGTHLFDVGVHQIRASDASSRSPSAGAWATIAVPTLLAPPGRLCARRTTRPGVALPPGGEAMWMTADDAHGAHDEGKTRRLFFRLLEQRAVVGANQSQIVGSPALHETQVARVIDDAGEIRVFVVDAHGLVMPAATNFAVEGIHRRTFARRGCPAQGRA